jgi:DNA-binding NarL/FixJ family response regulator
VEVNRADDPDLLPSSGDGVVKLALVEEEMVEDDIDLDVLESMSAKCIALAYNDKSVALRFFDHVSEREAFSRFGFLPMNLRYDCWVSMLRLLFLGHGCVPQDLMKLGGHKPPLDHKLIKTRPKPRLTPREREILALVARGKQNKLIAGELALSEHTVKLHMHHIIKKLGVRNRTEAAGIYLSNPRGSA